MQNLVRGTMAAAAMIALLVALQSAYAQPESFPNLNQLPAGWQLSQINPMGTNLWNVDNTGTQRPPGAVTNTSFSPSRTGPYSLNWNNGTHAWNGGVGSQLEGGVLTPVYDLTFAPNPQLRFWHLRDYYYYYPPPTYTGYMHAMIVRVWDTTLQTMHYEEEMIAPHLNVGTNNGVNGLVLWQEKVINLNRNWGQVRIEFVYKGQYGAFYEDKSAGWFIDDVEVTGLTPPTLGITNANALGSFPAGSPITPIQFTAQHGTPPYADWTVHNSVLPPGLSLNQTTGELTGTPTDAGNYGFTIRLRDSGNPQLTALKTFSMSITRPANFVYPVMNLPYLEDFATDTGWVFSTNNVTYGPSPGAYSDTSQGGWERGYATQSQQGTWNQDRRDPAVDRSPTTDNMLMGVKVGGVWPTNVNVGSWYWTYSPQINVGGYQRVNVEFWRWINQYSYYLNAQVEVWNPNTNTWMSIWSQTSPSLTDQNWQFESAPVNFGSPPAGGATTRIRFGWRVAFQAALTGNWGSGGWNLDDVRVIEQPSPGVVEILEWDATSTSYTGSVPQVFVGDTHDFILELRNNSPHDVEINSLTYSIEHPLDTPTNVGTMNFTQVPSIANPWIIPANTIFTVSDGQGGGAYPISFSCTQLHPNGNGTTVFVQLELLGKELGGQERATISNAVSDPAGVARMTISTLPPLAIADPTQLPDAGHNQPYSYTFSAVHGTPPYVNWTLVNGPTWIQQDAGNERRIFGTPTGLANLPQNFNVTMSVQDSANPAGNAQKQFTITVVAGGTGALQIVSPSQLPNATRNQPYAGFTLNATGGDPPYTWSGFQWLAPPQGAGNPGGLSFNAGTATLSGTPTGAIDQYAFRVTVTDQLSTAVTRTFYISVLPENPNVGIITISTPGASGAPPFGLETSPYNNGNPFVFEALGGYEIGASPYQYNWAITSGALPPGLTMDPDTGYLSGTPTQFGTYQFTLRASDGAFPPSTASETFTVHIAPLIPAPLVITTSSRLPDGEEMNIYSTQLNLAYGTPPYTWRVAGGSQLPDGLDIHPQSGVISGPIFDGQVPAPDQDVVFTIEVEDSTNPTQVAQKEFVMNVKAFITGALTVSTTTLPEGGVETPYEFYLRANGGQPLDPAAPYFWLVSPGSSLPTGLSLDGFGRLFGSPTLGSFGTHEFSVTVNDNNGNETSAMVTMRINPWPGTIEPSEEVIPGRRERVVKPIWEACSLSSGAGTGLLVLALLAAIGIARRRRLA